MALHWNWTNKVGKVIYKNGYEETLYQGNAFLIATHEYKEDGEELYKVTWFAVDRQHMKNMLGLNKKQGFDHNIFEDKGITDVYINSNHREAEKVIADIVKSKWVVNLHYYVEP